MKTIIFVLPIRPGKLEAWIRFTQALMNRHRVEYEASRRRLSIKRECFAVVQLGKTPVAVVTMEMAEPERFRAWLVEAKQPFARWFARQLRELHGIDLNQQRAPPEPVAEWVNPNFYSPFIHLNQGESQMSVQDNVKIVNRAFAELLSQGKLEVADEIYAADFTDSGEEGGPEHMKQITGMYRGAFPDLKIEVKDQFGADNKVVTRWRATGTHKGEFMDIAPSGNRVNLAGISIHRLENGRIVTHWGVADMLGLLQQIGAIPKPDAA